MSDDLKKHKYMLYFSTLNNSAYINTKSYYFGVIVKLERLI